MGIASLILGIIGMLISLTIFKDLSLILCILALVLGIISIVKKKSKGMAIAGVILAALGLILCFSVDDNNSTSGTGITNDSGSGSKEVKVSVDKVSIEKMSLTKSGDLVVKVTNNNEGSVCLSEIKANFKDKDGNFVLSKEADSSFIVIPGETSILTYFWGYDENYSDYPNVTFQTELANISSSFAHKGIELTSNNTGKQIAVTVKNTSGKKITDARVVVIYYKDGNIVGAESGFTDQAADDGNETYINVDYPQDSNYDNVTFDKYEVYYINASYE